MKISLLKLIALLIILYLEISSGQDLKDLTVELQQKEINGDNFDGHLNMSIKNISKDTIYIVSQPYNYNVIGNSKGIIIFVDMRFENFTPNRIVFFKKNINYLDARGGSAISYLKFPEILYLIPGKKTEINFNLDEIVLKELKGSNWDVAFDLWYAFKKDVDTAFCDKSSELKNEFERSLFYKDIFQIDLVSEKQPLTNDSLIYFNKIEKTSTFYYDGNESIYDSILRCFIRRY